MKLLSKIKENILPNILIIITVVILGLWIHSKDYEKSLEQTKEYKINNIEQRLTKQEQYMHQVQADLDNLYKVVE